MIFHEALEGNMERIASKSEELVNLMNLDNLIPFISAVKIFTIPELEDIYKERNDLLSIQRFLQELSRRGSNTLDKFITALKAAGDNEAAELLCENKDIFSTSRERNQCPSDAVDNLTLSANIQELGGGSTYKMNSIPRGYCLIINNVNFNDLERTRHGSDIDAVRLKIVLKYLGYCVSVSKDLTAEEMTKALSHFSKKPEHKNVDSCIVVLLSHGLEGLVKGTDAGKVYINDILDMFDNANCPNLKSKPKLFLINACRGHTYDTGVAINSADAVMTAMDVSLFVDARARRIPVLTDMFISYSTIEGYVSVRDDNQGSWYCQSLCGILKEFASKTDFQTMLGMVNREVACRTTSSGEMQATELVQKGWSGKKLYFNVL